MEYQLTAEVVPPADAPDLDALQRHGVAALLDEHLDQLAGIEGPDGVEIEPIDHRVAVHPGGALVNWVLDAPALVFAEDAARHVLTDLLERSELLGEWRVRRCEVTASDDELEAALSGHGTDESDGTEADTEVDDTLTEQDLADHRDQLRAASASLHAFGLETFGYDGTSPITEDQAQLLAGALIAGIEILTDELFEDIQELEEAEVPASDHLGLAALDLLPGRFADDYTALFAKQFLVVTAILGYRLTRPDWIPPVSTAEALALHLVKIEAEAQLELAGVADDLPLAQMLRSFDRAAFTNLDHEQLYKPADEGVGVEPELTEGLAFEEWFQPAHHPYLTAEN